MMRRNVGMTPHRFSEKVLCLSESRPRVHWCERSIWLGISVVPYGPLPNGITDVVA